MSDDLTARITEALARRVSCGASGDRYLVGGDARPLLAEARDEITRLNAHVEQLLNACDAADEAISMQAAQSDRLRALLDAPSEVEAEIAEQFNSDPEVRRRRTSALKKGSDGRT